MDIEKLDIESLGQGRIVTRVQAITKRMIESATESFSRNCLSDYKELPASAWDKVTIRRPVKFMQASVLD